MYTSLSHRKTSTYQSDSNPLPEDFVKRFKEAVLPIILPNPKEPEDVFEPPNCASSVSKVPPLNPSNSHSNGQQNY